MHLITTEELLAFYRCRRVPYLERWGPPDQKAETNDLVVQLRIERQALRHQVLASHPEPTTHSIESNEMTDEQVVLETQKLMASQVEQIHRGALQGHLPGSNTIQIRGRPDLLIWQAHDPKRSKKQGFYLPVEVRTSKRIKVDYEMMLAFHLILLRQQRPITPTTGMVVLGNGKWYTVNVLPRIRQALELMQDFVEMLEAGSMPQVYMARSRCGLCSWRSFCRQVAAETDPLTLLPGVTGSRHPLLQSAGIFSIEDLAQSSPHDFRHIPGLSPKVSLQLIRQAKATINQQALWIQPLKATELRSAPMELYFDIEADPQRDVSYLLGVLIVDQSHNTQHYQVCLATDPQAEPAIWESFLTLVEHHPGTPIYHYHGFEVKACEKLAKRYGTHSKRLTRLLERFVDLHEIVTQKVVLPVESYSLKNIARWLGFEWRLSDASGSQAIFWYARWLETQDQSYLDSIKIYNEDDCQATYRLKTWLANNQHQSLQSIDVPTRLTL